MSIYEGILVPNCIKSLTKKGPLTTSVKQLCSVFIPVINLRIKAYLSPPTFNCTQYPVRMTTATAGEDQ
jgi:hypothetical protein